MIFVDVGSEEAGCYGIQGPEWRTVSSIGIQHLEN